MNHLNYTSQQVIYTVNAIILYFINLNQYIYPCTSQFAESLFNLFSFFKI